MTIQDLIYDWELAADMPHRSLRTPSWPIEEERRRRLSFIEEEVEELFEAERNGDLVELADALGDIIWVVYGTAHAFGIDLDAILHEISDSNYSKLTNGGAFDENGKLVKGPDFTPPDIERVLEEQGEI